MSARRKGRQAASPPKPQPRQDGKPPPSAADPNRAWHEAKTAREARRQQQLAAVAARRQRARFVRWGTWAAGALVAVAVVAWLVLGRSADNGEEPGGLPGPAGGPEIAQDVNTLLWSPAPAFTLTDSEGTSYAVTPGQGRPLVLVFHMGIT